MLGRDWNWEWEKDVSSEACVEGFKIDFDGFEFLVELLICFSIESPVQSGTLKD